MQNEEYSGVGPSVRSGATGARGEIHRPRSRRALSVGDVQTYVACDSATEALIYLMVVFSPWAFGTTQPWSIWTMNIAGYALAALLAVKLAIRRRTGYRPPSWEYRAGWGTASRPTVFKRLLAAVTAAILAFCLISALNAQSSYDPSTQVLTPRDHCLTWLPHSLDAVLSWAAFWNYLALAGAFWAVVDWLPGKTPGEHRLARRGAEDGTAAEGQSGLSEALPCRLRRLLWVLTVNGGLLGLEGIAQRVLNSDKLLFLVQPAIHKQALGQFGPYAYRSNAAQYFILLWPACLGFWWMLRRSAKAGHIGRYVVLICAAIMAACPVVATTRAGAVITAVLLGLAGPALLAAQFLQDRQDSRGSQGESAAALRRGGLAASDEVRAADGRHGRRERHRRPALGHPVAVIMLFTFGALALGLSLGWKQLGPRFAQREWREGVGEREQGYERGRVMAEQYPVFGTGPGTFASIADYYRRPEEPVLWAQLHNDWLETRITFGWAGSALIATALALVLLRSFVAGGIHAERPFIVLCWLAVAGTLIFARWDFPFQIYSILFLFLILCAILVNLGRVERRK